MMKSKNRQGQNNFLFLQIIFQPIFERKEKNNEEH